MQSQSKIGYFYIEIIAFLLLLNMTQFIFEISFSVTEINDLYIAKPVKYKSKSRAEPFDEMLWNTNRIFYKPTISPAYCIVIANLCENLYSQIIVLQ